MKKQLFVYIFNIKLYQLCRLKNLEYSLPIPIGFSDKINILEIKDHTL